MKLTVPVITLLILMPVYSAASPSEQTTLVNALNAVIFKQHLLAVTQVCGDALANVEEVDTSETDKLILEKLKIDISKFVSIANVESSYYIDHVSDMRNLNCNIDNPIAQFEQAKENYDMALFRLSISSDYAEPLQSRAELQAQVAAEFVRLIRAKKESAYTIAIGKLIETSTVPEKYRNSFLPKRNPPVFTYHLEKGWKTSGAKFVAAERRSHEGSKYEESLKLVSEGAEFIFFIDQYNRIQDQIRVIDSGLILQELGKTHWYWSGGDLVKEAL